MQEHEKLEMEMAMDEIKENMHLTIKQAQTAAEVCITILLHYRIRGSPRMKL